MSTQLHARGLAMHRPGARTRAAFERFAAEHADALLRTAFLMTGDRFEAEDLAQECMLRVARAWPRVRSMEFPLAYARRVLFNLFLDGRAERVKRTVELNDTEFADARADGRITATVVAVNAELASALGELPAAQRAVLVLRYFADLPEAEVAEILGCSTGTVKSRASRGLERLRDVLERAAHPSEGVRGQEIRGSTT